MQNAHPDPPVADFGTMKFSIVVVDLLRLKVAGDLIIEHPTLHINLAQILEEARTYVSLKDRGWQSAMESIYPIKLNQVKVQDGSLLYLDNAKLTDLNGFLMAHEGMDVADGLLSVYAEITVKEEKVDGYIKPIIRNLTIYDKQKYKGKSFGNRVKMHFLQFLINVFENRSTQEVATVVQISGSTSDPKAGEWQGILKLTGNGFSNAVLPGFKDDSKGAASAKP